MPKSSRTEPGDASTTLSDSYPPRGEESASRKVVVVESRQSPGISQQPKEDYARFFLVISGRAQWKCEQRRYVLGPMTLCHVPPRLAIHQEISAQHDVLAYVIRYRTKLLSLSSGNQLAALGLVPLDLAPPRSIRRASCVPFSRRCFLSRSRGRKDGRSLAITPAGCGGAHFAPHTSQRRKGMPAFEPGSDSTDRVRDMRCD